MDNPSITHNTQIMGGHSIQAYVETGAIYLDLNGLDPAPDRRIRLDSDEAARLLGILRAALADKEA